jgi:hypothetical protein
LVSNLTKCGLFLIFLPEDPLASCSPPGVEARPGSWLG